MEDEKNKSLIFVVDDSRDTAELLGHFLKLNGYRTTVIESGQELIDQLENAADAELPDLILIDLMMPGLGGLEVTREIRAKNQFDYIPIIMVTANGDNSNRIRGLESGADDFLTKPVGRAELLARVRALLRLKQSHDEKSRLLAQVQEAYDRLAATQGELVEVEKRKSQVDGMLTTAAGICHEMSQPLTSALITLQLLRQTCDEQSQEDLSTIENSLLQARFVLDKLRALTRYETKPYNNQEMMLDLERSSNNLIPDMETRYGSDD